MGGYYASYGENKFNINKASVIDNPEWDNTSMNAYDTSAWKYVGNKMNSTRYLNCIKESKDYMYDFLKYGYGP